MSKTKLLSWGPISGALITLLLLGACAPAAGTGGQQAGGDWTLIVFLVLIFAIFYFLMIRPQRRRQKEHQKLIQELHKGDRVVLAGGIYGQIESIGEDTVIVKIESGAMKVARSGIIGKINT